MSMKIKNSVIKEILSTYSQIALLNKTKSVLDWDLNVNLPPKASIGRARQSSYLAELITNKWLDTDFRNLITKANNLKGLTEEEKAIIRNIHIATKFYYNVPK